MCWASISNGVALRDLGVEVVVEFGQKLVEYLPLGLTGLDNRRDGPNMGACDAGNVDRSILPVAAIAAFLDDPVADRFRQALEHDLLLWWQR